MHKLSQVLLLSSILAPPAFAGMPNLKLPFEAGESIPMTHGYWNGAEDDTHRFATDHFALDFGGCTWFRKPIVAAATGVVSDFVWDKVPWPTWYGRENLGYGNYVVLDHGDGYFSRYAHLDTVDTNVRRGETILQGRPLGTMGDTGNTAGRECKVDGVNHYGVHVHFALFKNGIGIKPEPMSGHENFVVRAEPYPSNNSPNEFAKAEIRSGRWIYWKINPSNPACSAGLGHSISESSPPQCVLATAADCPLTPTFIPVESIYGGASESPGPIPVTGGTNGGSLPNLIPNNSDIENASKQKVTMLHINEPGYCRMQTKNIGSQSAGAFQSRCYISDGSKIDNTPRDEGKEDTQSLGAGDTHTEHEDFAAPEYPGVYNAVWCTDSAKQVTESNEGDNCHVEDVFTVWSNPNIVTTSISLSGGRTTFLLGEAFSVDAVITNLGENFGKTILVGYYIDGVMIGTDNIKRENLKGGTSKIETLSQAYAPTVDGGHTFTVCADYDNRAQETNEADNCASIIFTVTDPNPPTPAPPPAVPVPPALPVPQHLNPAVYQLLFN